MQADHAGAGVADGGQGDLDFLFRLSGEARVISGTVLCLQYGGQNPWAGWPLQPKFGVAFARGASGEFEGR
jgi:hypothetical protein